MDGDLTSTFWSKLLKNLKIKFCSEIFKIDLNFFSKKKKLNVDLNLINNKIFIVHSFGLQWFIKKKFDCKVLINFFGSPNFLKFQKTQKKKKALDKMIRKF